MDNKLYIADLAAIVAGIKRAIVKRKEVVPPSSVGLVAPGDCPDYLNGVASQRQTPRKRCPKDASRDFQEGWQAGEIIQSAS